MAIGLRYALSPIQKTGIFPQKKREKSKTEIFGSLTSFVWHQRPIAIHD